MTKDLPVESAIATIAGDPDTIPMSVRHPTKEEKILPREEVEERNHHQERGVEMIVMNQEPLVEAMIRKGRTNHQGAIQDEDIKLILVMGIRFRL